MATAVLPTVPELVANYSVVQFHPQVGKRRFRSLVPIHAGRLQAVAAGAAADVDERLLKLFWP